MLKIDCHKANWGTARIIDLLRAPLRRSFENSRRRSSAGARFRHPYPPLRNTTSKGVDILYCLTFVSYVAETPATPQPTGSTPTVPSAKETTSATGLRYC